MRFFTRMKKLGQAAEPGPGAERPKMQHPTDPKRPSADKLAVVVEESGNHSQMLNQRIITILKHLENHSVSIFGELENQGQKWNERFEAVVQGLDNQSQMLNEKFSGVFAAQEKIARETVERCAEIVLGLENQNKLLNAKFAILIHAVQEGLPAEITAAARQVEQQSRLLHTRIAELCNALEENRITIGRETTEK